jgi:hypothetical protein
MAIIKYKAGGGENRPPAIFFGRGVSGPYFINQ